MQRFYRTLSEIKSEVESIIKTGRKMVEDKAVPEPQEFSKKIDMLKELYNKLGAQITESKSRLEYALLTAREIQNDLHALAGWLDGLGSHTGPQALELEMSRMEAIRNKLNANYADFAKNCDPAYLDKLRAQVDDINARWERLGRRDADELRRYLAELSAQLDAGPREAGRARALAADLRARAAAARDPALRAACLALLDKLTVSATLSITCPRLLTTHL